MKKANLIKVKVYPKDFKAIPDILPYNRLLQGDPIELEIDKKEILRCMNFADVYDLTSGEEVLIDEISFKNIVEFVEEEENIEDEEDISTADFKSEESENASDVFEDETEPEVNVDDMENII